MERYKIPKYTKGKLIHVTKQAPVNKGHFKQLIFALRERVGLTITQHTKQASPFFAWGPWGVTTQLFTSYFGGTGVIGCTAWLFAVCRPNSNLVYFYRVTLARYMPWWMLRTGDWMIRIVCIGHCTDNGTRSGRVHSPPWGVATRLSQMILGRLVLDINSMFVIAPRDIFRITVVRGAGTYFMDFYPKTVCVSSP